MQQDNVEQFLTTIVLAAGRGHRVADTPEETKVKIQARLSVIQSLRGDTSPEAKRRRKAAVQSIRRGISKFPYLVQVIAREVAQ
jgi:hypothetical protein